MTTSNPNDPASVTHITPEELRELYNVIPDDAPLLTEEGHKALLRLFELDQRVRGDFYKEFIMDRKPQ